MQLSDRRKTASFADIARAVLGSFMEIGSGVTATGTTLDLSVYGKIPAGQNVPAGQYADSVLVTITY